MSVSCVSILPMSEHKAASCETESASRKRKASVAALDDAPQQEDTSQASLRSILECPVCYNTMFPPIRQCSEGHNFCDKCCTKLMTSEHDSARKCACTLSCALASPAPSRVPLARAPPADAPPHAVAQLRDAPYPRSLTRSSCMTQVSELSHSAAQSCGTSSQPGDVGE